jgi:hypothetical protein
LVESSGYNSLISCPTSSIQFIKDSFEGILKPVTDIINCSLIISTYPVVFQKLVEQAVSVGEGGEGGGEEANCGL